MIYISVLDIEYGEVFDGDNEKQLHMKAGIRWNLAIAQFILGILLLLELLFKWCLDFRVSNEVNKIPYPVMYLITTAVLDSNPKLH